MPAGDGSQAHHGINYSILCAYLALDVPGVLGKIAQFGEAGVSLSAVKQPVSTPGELTNIYFLTHKTKEESLQRSLEHIRKLEVVKEAYAIRVEEGG